MRLSTVLAGLLALGAVSARGGDPQAPPEFATGSYRVSVDFVVRDKDGKLIPDLTPADVEVFEDGVRQEVEALRLVRRAEADAPTAPAVAAGAATTTPVVAPEGPEVIALVFDRLLVENRAEVRRAMLDYFKDHWRPGQRVGVFKIGRRLGIAQTFTDEKDAILGGIDRALGWEATEQYAGDRDAGAVNDLRARLDSLPSGGGGGPMGGGGVAAMTERMRLSMVLRTYETFREIDADQQGLRTLDGLRALVSALSVVPGRKAIVFLTESFALNNRTESHFFRTLVPAANDAQVSIYSVDAAGLRIFSENATLAASLSPGAEARHEDVAAGYQADVLQSTKMRALFQLADSTGGVSMRSSNDLARALFRADEDLGAYYLLSYSPTNETFDGGFREIKVKVRRAHGDLRARRGYLAVRTRAWAGPVLAYEAPALARLDKDPKANQIPMHVQALLSPVSAGHTVVAVLAEVRGGDLSIKSDDKTAEFSQDFTIVAIVRDDKGRVIRKLSEYYPLKGPLAELETANQSRVLFYKETELPPGRLSVEVVLHDNRTGTASVRRLALPVPATDAGRLRAGSLMLVARAEEAAPVAADGHEGVLVSRGLQLYPNLGEPLTAGTASAVFFLRAMPAPGRTGVRATLDVLRGERLITSAKLGEVSADAHGRVDLLSEVSLAKLGAGSYDVRLTLRDAQDVEVRSTRLTIGP